jgi:hypothetical protein
MSRGWEGGSTRQWRKIRDRVLARDGHRCQLRLPGCTGRAEHVHHVHGKAAGDGFRNLLAACAHCNLSLGDPTKPKRSGSRRPAPDPPVEPRTLWAVGRFFEVHGGGADSAYARVSPYPRRVITKFLGPDVRRLFAWPCA